MDKKLVKELDLIFFSIENIQKSAFRTLSDVKDGAFCEKSQQPLTFFAITSILDVWQSSEHVSDTNESWKAISLAHLPFYLKRSEMARSFQTPFVPPNLFNPLTTNVPIIYDYVQSKSTSYTEQFN